MSEREAVDTVVRGLVDAVNQGEFATALSAFSEAAVIVEDIPPFRWEGADAASEWIAAMGANAVRMNVGSVLMRLERATRIEVAGGSAYAVFPGQLRLRSGEAQLSADGILTLTLRAVEGRWLIDTLAWGGPEAALM